MNALYSADWHLTTQPDDEYRWGVFPWLRAYAGHENLDCLWILGDLTDRTDEHPAELVNRLCDELAKLSDLCPVYILAGNHDYVERSDAFFRFLDRQLGIRFFHEPASLNIKGLRFKVLPHHYRPTKQYRKLKLQLFDRILFHQAIEGAVGDNGYRLPHGLSRHAFAAVRDDAFCLGGDLHRPQQFGSIRYVGAPHPIKFGDDYTPGAVLERSGKLIQLERSTLKKLSVELTDVEQLSASGLDEGDFAKVSVTLPRHEIVRIDRHRARLYAIAEEIGVSLRRVSFHVQAETPQPDRADGPVVASPGPRDVLRQFAAARGIDETTEAAGAALLVED